jgi:hypothetical protein
VERSGWPNFKVLSQHSPGGTEENHEHLSRDSRFPDKDLNPEPLEYEAGVLTTRPRRSVITIKEGGYVSSSRCLSNYRILLGAGSDPRCSSGGAGNNAY